MILDTNQMETDDNVSEITLFQANNYVSPPHSPVTEIKSVNDLNQAKKHTPENSPERRLALFSIPHSVLDLTTPSMHLRSAKPPKLSDNTLTACTYPRVKRKRRNEVESLQLENFIPIKSSRREVENKVIVL